VGDYGIYQDKNTKEWFFSDTVYMLSQTDEKGFIIYANDVFCKIAQYEKDELIGKPHNIIRHPDVPKTVFKTIWDSIQGKGFFEGVIKNRSKDGAYYWVYASILRNTDKKGIVTYLSVRQRPTREQIKEAQALYATLD
jgi:aerotaxis receptor